MVEVVFESPDDLYTKLVSVNPDPAKHGPLANFYAKAKVLHDPNVCSCKKGRKAKDEVLRAYMSLPVQIRPEPNLSMAKALLGAEVLVFRTNGMEFSRIG